MTLILDAFLPYRLNRLAEAASDEVRPIYRDRYGMNRPEWRTLIVLAHLGRATATEICIHSNQHKTKVSRAVRALEDRRWLKREAAPGDRRSEVLALTPAGKAAFDELAAPGLEREADILARLTPEDSDALARALTALEQALGIRTQETGQQDH